MILGKERSKRVMKIWGVNESKIWEKDGMHKCKCRDPDWGFSVLFLSCKANARVKLAKSGHGPHLFRIIVFYVVLVIVLCYCLYAVLLLLCCTVIVLLCYYLCCPMYWLCVLYHCHRVLTQLQLTNISITCRLIGKVGKRIGRSEGINRNEGIKLARKV